MLHGMPVLGFLPHRAVSGWWRSSASRAAGKAGATPCCCCSAPSQGEHLALGDKHDASPPIARAAIAANIASRSDFHKRGGKVLASSLRTTAVISVGFEVAVCLGSLSFLPALFLLRATVLPAAWPRANSQILTSDACPHPHGHFRTKGDPVHGDVIQEPMRPSNGDREADLADVGRFDRIAQLIYIEIGSGTNAGYCWRK